MPTPSTFPSNSYQQGWTKYAFDQRTFGELIADTLDEINKPDLQQPAIRALRDAILYWREKPLFFSERDNRSLSSQGWIAGFFWSMGATIRRTVSGVDYAFVACTQGNSGTVEPVWPATTLTPPSYGTLITNALAGTVQDGDICWANAGLWSGNSASGSLTGSGYDQYGVSTYWTQLSMVPNVNQYNVPLDYRSHTNLQAVVSGISYDIDWIPYETYSAYDVVRPPVLSNYPTAWTTAQQQLYLWPYPNQFAPLFLIYTGSDIPPTQPSEINTWTTVGSRLVRCWAKKILNAEVLRDTEAAALDEQAAKEEFDKLQLSGILKTQTGGIPPSGW